MREADGRKAWLSFVDENGFLLVFEARQHADRHLLLGLFVDPRNHRAIKAYRKAGFTDFHRICSEEGIDYISMILKLEAYHPHEPTVISA